MTNAKTTLERAFEIAASGRAESVAQIRTLLKAEGYETQQIYGRALAKQLGDIVRKEKASAKRTDQ
jgi:hypothetical protein